MNSSDRHNIGTQNLWDWDLLYRQHFLNLSSLERKILCHCELSEWEDSHIGIFESMRAELPDRIRYESLFDPDDEYRDYLQAAADSHVFIKNHDVSELVARCGSPFKALDLALEFEKDSVVYYTTIKKAVSAHLGAEKIDALIEEELKHISLLNDRQKKYKKG